MCSRAFIRHLAQDPDLAVPSPTFLLKNSYAAELLSAQSSQQPDANSNTASPANAAENDAAVEVHHMDLYRLDAGSPGLQRLQMQESCASGICLIEWPDRLSTLPSPAIHLAFAMLTKVCMSLSDVKEQGLNAKLLSLVVCTLAPSEN